MSEGVGSQMLGSGNTLGRGSGTLPEDVPPLPHCLLLDPITLGNQKYTRSGELRRILGVPLGSTTEEQSLGVTHKKLPPVASEELKHFKESVQETSRMARDRVKQFRDSIFKLDKYREALSSKKWQRSDVSPIERSEGGVNLSRIGSQIRRNPQDVMSQRLKERTKSVGINKRVRPSVVDVWADGRPAATSRQPIVTENDGDMLPAVSEANIQIEEKIRGLPVGGEGWDKKMKRKRSVAIVGNRLINGDQDIKRVMQPKLNAGSKLRICDAQSFRSKSSLGVGGGNKLDGPFELSSLEAGTVLRNELEGPPPRDHTTLLEQRVVGKGKLKLNVQEDSPGNGPSTMLKGKASRGPRTGSFMVLNSSSKPHPSCGTFEGFEEQPTSGNKVPLFGMSNNQKRTIFAVSSSQAMAQWVGQRPQKISRTRRTNLVSPVLDSEAQVLPQGLSTPDLSARTSSFGANGSLLAYSLDNNTPRIKREFENVSPFGSSEIEKSGAGETQLKGKGTDSDEGVAHEIGSFTLPARKNKILTNEVGDVVRRQGGSVGASALTRIHLKSNVPMTMPVQSMRPASEKNKSKSGRPPSKKLKDCKGSSRVGQMVNNVTSDFTGVADDDHEELLAAANTARNIDNLACSGPFWKKMKTIFASLSSKDISYLKQQLSFAEELERKLFQIVDEYNLMGVWVRKELPNSCHGHPNQEKVNSDALNGRFDVGKSRKGCPLYQRLLSALIEEDDIDELYDHREGKNLLLNYASDDSNCGSCSQMDIEPKDRDKMEYEVESEVDFQSQKSCLLDRLSGDKSVASNTFRYPSTSSSVHSNGQWLEEDDFSHSYFGLASEICSKDLAHNQMKESNFSSISSDCQYQLMCLDDKLLLELQSIGLYPGTLFSRAKGRAINEDIMELEEGLYEQIGRKKNKLTKLDEAILKWRDVERRNIERCAMDQLIEMAYRKRLACGRSHVSKSAARKASIQVALAFIARTLARCQKFEETGSSCFNEPPLHDILFNETLSGNEAKSADCVGSGTASNTCNETFNNQTEARGSGAISSTYKHYDFQSENLDRGSSDALQAGVYASERVLPKNGILLKKVKKEVPIDDFVGSSTSRPTSTFNNPSFGGARGKRSERENKNQSRTISISAVGSSVDSFKSERKTKAKSKLKNNHDESTITLHGTNTAGESNPSSVTNPRNERDRGKGSSSLVNIRREPLEEADELENLELHEFDIEDAWFNGLQDYDSMGLEIPMDDLSDLNMLL